MTRVAIIHDWLVEYGGGERALAEIIRCFPGADVFVPVDFMAAEHRHILGGARVQTSFVQQLPWARTRYWDYIGLMPLAMEQFDLAGYDLVVSNSHSVAKGVLVHPEQVHVSYVLSPMRFAWDLQPAYLREFGLERGPKSWVARMLLHRLRLWDSTTPARVDAMAAPSRYIARRIQICYRREADIIPPPVNVDYYCPSSQAREDFYLTASRLIPFKRMALLVQAFARMPGRRLVVIGDGPELEHLRGMAPTNVTLSGYQPDEVLRDHMRRARAFVFAPPEDFGIVMVEAQACGTPVIAFGRGGALDIVRGLDHDVPTGVLFDSSTPESVIDAIATFERAESRITPEACRQNALRFGAGLFRERFTAFAAEALARYGSWSGR
jgi:glycosyltransferase involved in cell wall biosynthesis